MSWHWLSSPRWRHRRANAWKFDRNKGQAVSLCVPTALGSRWGRGPSLPDSEGLPGSPSHADSPELTACHPQMLSPPQAEARSAPRAWLAGEGPLVVGAGMPLTPEIWKPGLVRQSSQPPGRCGIAATAVLVLVLGKSFWFGCESAQVTHLKQCCRAQPGTGLLSGSGQVERH